MVTLIQLTFLYTAARCAASRHSNRVPMSGPPPRLLLGMPPTTCLYLDGQLKTVRAGNQCAPRRPQLQVWYHHSYLAREGTTAALQGLFAQEELFTFAHSISHSSDQDYHITYFFSNMRAIYSRLFGNYSLLIKTTSYRVKLLSYKSQLYSQDIWSWMKHLSLFICTLGTVLPSTAVSFYNG